MMPAPGEKSETAKLMEMVQKVVDSSQSASPRAIQSALASQNPKRSLNQEIRGLGSILGVSVW
jgi:hypothetical protein